MRISETYPANQWAAASFWRLVDKHERAEVRAAAAYSSGPIDVAAIRDSVLSAILSHAIPAGNA